MVVVGIGRQIAGRDGNCEVKVKFGRHSHRRLGAKKHSTFVTFREIKSKIFSRSASRHNSSELVNCWDCKLRRLVHWHCLFRPGQQFKSQIFWISMYRCMSILESSSWWWCWLWDDDTGPMPPSADHYSIDTHTVRPHRRTPRRRPANITDWARVSSPRISSTIFTGSGRIGIYKIFYFISWSVGVKRAINHREFMSEFCIKNPMQCA